MNRRTKADMARELDALRHRVSQQAADIQRLEAVIVDLRTKSALHREGMYASRRDAMAAAKAEAIATGKSVVVRS